MDSKERVKLALAHQEPDRVPFDLGSSPVTGMHVSSVYRLRQALQLDPPGTPVKVIEPSQMLGELDFNLVRALGVDTIGLSSPLTMYGFRKENWKEWRLFDGTPVLVPEAFNTEPEPDGSLFMYAEGDRTAAPSAQMPKGGFYFDNLDRQAGPIDEEKLNPEDNCDFGPVTPDQFSYVPEALRQLSSQSDKAVVANYWGAGYGDVALVSGPHLKQPRGIRSTAEWYMSLAARPDYVRQVFERQCANVLEYLAAFYPIVGNSVDVICMSGTDFGMQRGPLVSPKIYRELFKPYHRAVNDWIHRNTPWKTFIHSCGSDWALLPDFIEAGFDILNPVQTSAARMDPRALKECFGDRITFWGGGIDTQRTLPFGTPEEIRREVGERMEIFGRGGGFVFSPIHNIQPRVPVENLLALFEAVREYQ